MNEEMLKKAKGAKSAEELKGIAAEYGTELTDESAAAYYEQLHKAGEMADEELENVAGGGCHKGDGRLIVTVGHCCDGWVCARCGSGEMNGKKYYSGEYRMKHYCPGQAAPTDSCCNNCKYMSYEKGLWLCNNPANS